MKRVYSLTISGCHQCPEYLYSSATGNHWCTKVRPNRVLAGYDGSANDLPEEPPRWCPLPVTKESP